MPKPTFEELTKPTFEELAGMPPITSPVFPDPQDIFDLSIKFEVPIPSVEQNYDDFSETAERFKSTEQFTGLFTGTQALVRPKQITKEIGKGFVRFLEMGVGGTSATVMGDWLGQFITHGGHAVDWMSKIGTKNKHQVHNPIAQAIIATGENLSAEGRRAREAWAYRAATRWESLDNKLRKSDPISYGAGRLSEGVSSSALAVLSMYLSGGAAAPELLNKGVQINRGLVALSTISAAGGFDHAQRQDENFVWSTLHGLADGMIEYAMESTFLEGIGKGTGKLTAGVKEGLEEFFTGMMQNTHAGMLENFNKGMSAYESAKDAVGKSLRQSPWEVAAGFIGGFGIAGGAQLTELYQRSKEVQPTPVERILEKYTEMRKAVEAREDLTAKQKEEALKGMEIMEGMEVEQVGKEPEKAGKIPEIPEEVEGELEVPTEPLTGEEIAPTEMTFEEFKETALEEPSVYENIARNESPEAAKLVKQLHLKGIPTSETHQKEKQISIRLSLPKDSANLKRLQEAQNIKLDKYPSEIFDENDYVITGQAKALDVAIGQLQTEKLNKESFRGTEYGYEEYLAGKEIVYEKWQATKPTGEAIAPAERKVVSKLKDQGKLGFYEEDLFIKTTQHEIDNIVSRIKRNEGKQAADIVKSLLDKGVQTESTHVTKDEIIVGVSNLSEGNKVILQNAGLTVEKMPPLSGEFIRFTKQAKPTPTGPTIAEGEIMTDKGIEAREEALARGEEGRKFREALGLEEPADPIRVIEETLKTAAKLRPEISEEKTAELRRRVAIMADTMESLRDKGIRPEEAIRRSTGALKGELTDYNLRYESIREKLSDEVIDTAFNSILDSKTLRPLTKENTRRAFSKLIDGSYLRLFEADLIADHFGLEMGKVARQRVPWSESWTRTLAEYLGIVRTTLTAASGDMSGIMRQARPLGQVYPLKFLRFVGQSAKAWGSEDLLKKMDEASMNLPFIDEAATDGVLEGTKYGEAVGEPVERGEEFIGAGPLEKVPIIKYPVKAAERAFTALNLFRRAVYSAVRVQATKSGTDTMSIADRKRIASIINDMSGRAYVKRTKAAKAILPYLQALFAPRFRIARLRAPLRMPVEMARAGRRLVTGERLNLPELRMTAGAFASMIGTNLLIMHLIKTAYIAWGDDPEDIETETDLRATDGGKLRIKDMHIDLWAGYLQDAQTYVQLATGQARSQGGELYDIDRVEVLKRAIRKRTRPIVSLIVDAVTGETVAGKRFGAPPKGEEGKILDSWEVPEWLQGAGIEAWNRVTPLVIQDAVDALAIEGVPESIMMGALSHLGVSVATYEKWATSELQVYKNQIALDRYGKKWEALTPKQQEEFQPEIDRLELLARQERPLRPRSKYISPEDEELRERMFTAMPRSTKDELQRIGADVGGISQFNVLGLDKLSDRRFKFYEEQSTKYIKAELSKLFASPVYKRQKLASAQQEMVRNKVNAAKEKARKKLLNEMKLGTI